MRKFTAFLLLSVIFLLVACTPEETPVPPTETATPLPTKAPTKTPLPPTETPTLEPTKDLPEVLVTKYADLVGAWKSKKFGKYEFTFYPDGRTQTIDQWGHIEWGEAKYERDLLVWTSKGCEKADASTGGALVNYTCTGTYRVYLSKDGSTPVHLRFELIEDPHIMRENMLTTDLLVWVEE